MHTLHNNQEGALETTVGVVAPVLIVDDHSLLSGSLAMVLASKGCAVRTLKATTVEQFQAEIVERPPAATLVRIQPGPSLACTLAQVEAATNAGSSVVVLSDSRHELLVSAAVNSGAQGLVASTDLMVDAVDQILAIVKGEQLLSELRRNELLHLFRTHRDDRDNRLKPFESLTRREGEVLCLLMEGLSVTKVAESSSVSIGTVRTQVKAILRKLGVNSQAAAVALAYRNGWPDADPELPVDLRSPKLA